jgi:hypothetical protein
MKTSPAQSSTHARGSGQNGKHGYESNLGANSGGSGMGINKAMSGMGANHTGGQVIGGVGNSPGAGNIST